MRIGLVLPGFSADQTDWCIPALRDFARELARGEELRVFSVRYPYRRGAYRVDGTWVMAIGGGRARGPRALVVWRSTLRALAAAHRTQPFDLLHAFWATESGLLASIAGRVLRVPVLVSVAGGELVRLAAVGYGDQRSGWERLKIEASLRLATRLSAGSSQQVRSTQARAGPGRRVAYAPLGVDTARFSPAAAPSTRPETPRLLHVGGLVGVKDQRTLVRAFARLHARRRGVMLDIVGDGPLRSRLEQDARGLGVADAVRFRGPVDHALLPRVYRASDVFVLSSLHEAQGMVVLEAAACGVPTVGTRVGVVAELAPSAARAVPPGDPDALATAVATLLDEPAQRGEVGQAAMRRLLAEFELRRCVGRFRELYAELVGSGGGFRRAG